MSTTPSQAEPGATPDPGSAPPASRSPVLARPRPTPKPRIELCPYCGRESVNTTRCSTCGGQFDALSKQATQNAMGPWWLREGDRPLRPGCSYETIKGMVGRGTISADTVLRGPTTRQFWTRATRVPGVAHLLGKCHSCQRDVAPDAFMCAACGASFVTETDRQHLGLSPVALLPGQAAAERIAAVSAAALPVPMGEIPAPPSPVASPTGRDLPGVRTFDQISANDIVRPSPSSRPAVPIDLPAQSVVKYVKRPRSMAGTLAIMLFGAMMAVGGVWVALLSAQGSASNALLALGIDSGVADPAAARRRQTNQTLATSTTTQDSATAPDTSRSPVEPTGDPVASVPAPEAAQSQTPTTPDSPRPQPASVLTELTALVREGNMPRAQALVNDAERERQMTPDEAAAWRTALEARLARAAMRELP